MYCRGILRLVYSFDLRDVEVNDDDGHLHHCGNRIQNVKGGNGDGDSDRVHRRCGHSNLDVEGDSDGDLPHCCGHRMWIVVAHSDDDVHRRCGRHDTSVHENLGYDRLDGDGECLKCDGDVCSYFSNSEHSTPQSGHMG